MNPELADIWHGVQQELRRSHGDATYDIWLAPLEPVSLRGSTLSVRAPAELRTWVAERFARTLSRAAVAVLGEGATVDVVGGEADGSGPSQDGRTPRRTGRRRAADAGAAEDAPPEPGLNPKFTFGQFVIGDANRFAHAAALAVAELPGQAYNPLFVYGPPGVGKTHLLHSIGNYVLCYGAGLTVHYTTIERFTNDFVGAVQSGSPDKVDRFKGRYRHNDVLLIDDVQFLESKVKTEEEFFHTFNELYDTGSQLVLTSDRLPRDLGPLQDRLLARFEAGLVTDIRPPDLATRLAVLRKRVHHDQITLEDDAVLGVLAERIPSNVRALEGALIRVVAFGSLTGRALSGALATEVLDGLYGHGDAHAGDGRARRVSLARIAELTCQAFSLTGDELLSASRAARVTWPRQVAMYLAREHTDATLPAIGAHFGGRNHTTVMYAVRRTAERLATDPDAYETVRELTSRLHRPDPDRGP